MVRFMPSRTVVLVHGAWHGGWCWQPVVDRLDAKGIRCLPLDLPGHGADPGRLTDLYGDAAAVREVLDSLDGPTVLVGHSYGGAVITESGDHPAVTDLVFVCAFALDEGESCVSAAAREAADISHAGRPDLGAGFRAAADDIVTVDPEVAARCFFHDCDAATVDWALARIGPQRLTTFQQEPTTIAWRNKRSTYAVCTDDLAVHPDLQRLLARRCTTSVEWPSSHSPFLSHPDLVAELLADVAVGAPPGGAAHA
jgi:pimeloyl-ACP methyl ester carboxylesterase